MLQILRNKAQSTIIQTLVLIIAVVFVFWGVGTNMMNDRNTAISVNKEEISFQEYQQRYEQTIAQYRQQFGDAVSDELLKSLGVKEQVINQLTQTALLRQGAGAMGIAVAPAEIQQTIQKMPQFTTDGAFDMAHYKAILAANRMTPHKFEASIGRDLIHEKSINLINNFAIKVSDAALSELYQQDMEQVTVEIVKVSPEHFSNTVKIEDDKLVAWFDKEKDRYKSEQKIKLSYLSFPYLVQKEGLVISDEQVLAQYEKDMANWQVPEQRHARHILFRTAPGDEQMQEQRKKAEEVLSKAKAGEDFSTLAKMWSEDSSKVNGGDLGTFGQGRMVPEFDNAVFSMAEGAVSDIITTQFGLHIIKLEKIHPATTKSLEEVRDTITTRLRDEQAKAATFQLANSVYEGIITAGSLKAYADKHQDSKVMTTDFFSRSTPPDNLGKEPKFMETIFAMKKGELSSLAETKDGYFILYAEEIQEPAPPSLETVKKQATEDFRMSLAQEAARETSASVLKKLKEGADFASTIKEAGLTAIASKPIQRKKSDPDPNLPSTLIPEAMRLSASTPYPLEPLSVGADFFILHFQGRILPEADKLDEANKKNYTRTLLQQQENQLLGAWLKNQEKGARIAISKNLQ